MYFSCIHSLVVVTFDYQSYHIDSYRCCIKKQDDDIVTLTLIPNGNFLQTFRPRTDAKYHDGLTSTIETKSIINVKISTIILNCVFSLIPDMSSGQAQSIVDNLRLPVIAVASVALVVIAAFIVSFNFKRRVRRKISTKEGMKIKTIGCNHNYTNREEKKTIDERYMELLNSSWKKRYSPYEILDNILVRIKMVLGIIIYLTTLPTYDC